MFVLPPSPCVTCPDATVCCCCHCYQSCIVITLTLLLVCTRYLCVCVLSCLLPAALYLFLVASIIKDNRFLFFCPLPSLPPSLPPVLSPTDREYRTPKVVRLTASRPPSLPPLLFRALKARLRSFPPALYPARALSLPPSIPPSFLFQNFKGTALLRSSLDNRAVASNW